MNTQSRSHKHLCIHIVDLTHRIHIDIHRVHLRHISLYTSQILHVDIHRDLANIYVYISQILHVDTHRVDLINIYAYTS